MANIDIDLGKYSLGWSDPEEAVFKPEKGLNEEIIRQMSEIKKEPEWMLEFRLKAYKRFLNKPLPEWVAKEKLQKLEFMIQVHLILQHRLVHLQILIIQQMHH